MIHVCFCFNDKMGCYSKFAGTAMLSMFSNHTPPHLPSITVHILHDNTLSIDNREKFIQIAKQYNQLVKFYNVEELCADKLNELINLFPSIINSRVTVGGFYRLVMSQLIPSEIEKIIYLDSDVIINLDINELWQINLGDAILGVVTEKMAYGKDPVKRFKLCSYGIVKGEDYFNSGILLVNLNKLRLEEENVRQGVKFRGENNTRFFDQDILNYCFSTQTLKLPLKFNRFVVSARRKHEINLKSGIYHYAGHRQELDQNDIFNRLWMSYFIRSPWFNEDVMGRLYEGFFKIRNDLQTRIGKLSAIMSNKTRAFFVEPSKIESIKEFFSIRDDEEIIPAENEDSIQKLIDAMKVFQDKCVFFIMTPKFLKKKFPFDLLTKEGFALDKDFVKGWEFLSEDYGNPLNSYGLIKAM